MEPGLDDPCPCGSGNKYTHCCLQKDQAAARERSQEEETDASAWTMPSSSQFDFASEEFAADAPADDVDARWDEFQEAGYEERIALFHQTIDDGLMDEEIAFEFLSDLFYQMAERDERHRFEELANTLRERLPEIYAREASYILDWRITNAIVAGHWEQLSSLVEDMGSQAKVDLDVLDRVFDQLAYHGQLSALLAAARAAWPRVRKSSEYFEWAILEFGTRCMDIELFDYLERTPEPQADDPALLDRLGVYSDSMDLARFQEYLVRLTGQVEGSWQGTDFEVEVPMSPVDVGEDEDLVDEFQVALEDFSTEFLGWLRRSEEVSYTKGEMAREGIVGYLVQRQLGEPEAGPDTFDPLKSIPARRKKRKRPRKTRSASTANPLVPDRGTLDAFLGSFFGLLKFQPYPVAAIFELLPAWLRFLECHHLIDSEAHDAALSDISGLVPVLRDLWHSQAPDPALEQALKTWPAGSA